MFACGQTGCCRSIAEFTPEEEANAVAILVREAFYLSEAFTFSCRVGSPGTPYEAKCATTERTSCQLSMGTQYNYTLLYNRANLPADFELHLKFFSDWTAGGKLLGEAKIPEALIFATPSKFVSFPIEGTSGQVVLYTGPDFTQFTLDHIQEVHQQDGCCGTSPSGLRGWMSSASHSWGVWKDYVGTKYHEATSSLAGQQSATGMKDWYRARSTNGKGEDTGIWNGPRPEHCVCISKHKDVSEALKTLGEKLGTSNMDSDCYRINSLGIATFYSGGLWPEVPERCIGLGQTQENHAFCRKFLARALGEEGPHSWTTAQIRTFAREFWKGRKQVGPDVGNDFWTWNQQVLHKLILGLDMSLEDATDFQRMQMKIITGTSAPEFSWGMLGVNAALQKKLERLEKYKPLIQAKFPEETFTEKQLTLLTSVFLDALIFAGGVAIPSMGSMAFTTLYSTWGKECLGDWKLKKSNVKLFVFEVVRRYQSVTTTVFAEKNKTGLRKPDQLTFVNLMMACCDPEAWGPDANKFRVRSLEEYHEKHVGWADLAMFPENGSPNSHACPAKDLSITILSELLLAFMVETIGEEAVEKDEPMDLSQWKPDHEVVMNEMIVLAYTLTRV